MRISYMLLFVAIFCLHAENAISQKITLEGDNLSVKEYLNIIEQQTDFLFIYDADVNVNKKISVKMENKSIQEVLESFSKQLGLDYSQKGTYIVLSNRPNQTASVPVPAETAQQGRTITGTVTDESGLPIIGANVVEKGTTNGVITDMDGKFSLTLQGNHPLEISYIGFTTQTVSIHNQTTLTVVLKEDTQTLDEVVVVGYGTQKKVNLTGAVAAVSSEVMANRPVTNIAQALQGVVPNLNVNISDGAPNTFASYNVRGATSMSKNSSGTWQVDNGSPLILVDGIEMENFNFSALNPNDIESISVIKDASASAIYGARAAYGVILATTKQGAKGKSHVQYSYDVQWNHPSARPDFMNSYDAEYARVMHSVYTGGNITTDDEIRLEALQNYIDNPVPENA